MIAQAATTLALFAPVVIHDANETSPLAGARGEPVAVYARAVPAEAGGEWLQYWLHYAYQDQDRGIVRTGRHEGDWELAQYRVEDDRLVEAVYAQHSGAERCGASEVERRDGRPVVYAAHGSHASYLQAGTRDRMWPDPNDEADGRGLVVAPRLVPITASNAFLFASSSVREGITADMPPMACAPRAWQVLTSSSEYACMNGTVIVTSERFGSTKSGRDRKRLMTEKM